MLHAVTFHTQNGSMTQRHYHGGKCLAYRFRWWAGAVAVCRFLWGSLARWNAAWQHTAVDLCPCVSPGVWLFSNFCPHPAGPQSDAFPFLFFSFSSLSLHKAHSSPSLPSLSPPPLPLSAPRDTKKDAELHCYIFVYLTYSFYLLPPLSELGPVVICITWPLLQGTSASLSPELWYWNDSSPRELNRVSVEMHWGKSVQQEACRIARYSEEWKKKKSMAEKRRLSQYSV